MNYDNPFDRLVSELGKEERLTLLDKLSMTSLPAAEIEAAEESDTTGIVLPESDIHTKLRQESILLKF